MRDPENMQPFDFGERVDITKTRISARVIVEPRHDDTVSLIGYWNECTARGAFRLGRDLPSAAVGRLMSRLIVLEPLPQNSDFRIRLAGGGLLRRFGFDVSGRLLSDVYDRATFENYAANLRTTLDNGRPLVIDCDIAEGPVTVLHIEYVFLPALSRDGLENWVVAGAFYFS